MNIETFLSKAEQLNMRRKLNPMQSISATECIFSNNNKKYIDFSSNDYLALAKHPKLAEASIKWIKKYGTGSRASRLVSGSFPEYIKLEKKIADWKGTEAAIIIGNGYMANTGIIAALADRHSTVFADKLNHASLNAGIQLSNAEFKRFKHKNIEHLETLLSINENPNKLIVADTVFSMDGDITDIKKVSKIAEKYSCMLYFDDAHGTGVFGKYGEGLSAYGTADISMGTFSKGMGTYGAYVACSVIMKDYLINKCNSFIYSTALPPGVYGSIDASIDLVKSLEYQQIRKMLLEKCSYTRDAINKLGYDTAGTQSPIIPIIIGSVDDTMYASAFLKEKGIFAVPIRPPTVPNNSARIRISLNSEHTDSQIHCLLDALAILRKKITFN